MSIRFRSLCRAFALTLVSVAVLVAPSAQASSYTPVRGTDFFAASGVWNRPLDADAPLASDSSTLVSTLNWEVGNYGTWINSDHWSTGVYTVAADQPTVHVTLDQNKPRLQADFNQVPLPPDAHPAAGTDGHLVVWQPSTQTMWEFWQLHTDGSGNWHTSYGGKMTNVSSNPGYFQQFGATATGLPIVGGLMTLQEETDGAINHALQIAIPHARAGVWVYPAQRSDGDNPQTSAIPEGTRFRLPANLFINPLWPRQTQMMARAVQKYGMIVDDQSGSVSFRAEDPYLFYQQNHFDPYGPYAYGGLSPSQLLAFFPWTQLQVVRP